MAEPIEIYLGEVDFPCATVEHVEAVSDTGNVDEVNSRLRSKAALLGANAVVHAQYEVTTTSGSLSAMRGTGLAVRRLSDEVPCPSCAEKIKRAAIRCRFCGTEIESAPHISQTPEPPSHDPEIARYESSTTTGVGPGKLWVWTGGLFAVIAILILVQINGRARPTPTATLPPTASISASSVQTRFMDDPRNQGGSAPRPQVLVPRDTDGVTTQPAATPPPPVSRWSYSDRTDQMSNDMIRQACTLSTNSVRLGWPYEAQTVRLCVRQHPRWGQDVIVSLTQGGQFICRSYNNCIVRVRFDEGTASGYSANEPDDHSSDTIFITNDARFVTNLKRSSRVIIESEFYQAGAQQMVFDTAELEWPRQ